MTPVVPFLNPDPIAHLVWWSNKAPVIVDGQKVTASSSGAQISSRNSWFCEQMALMFHPLHQLLELKGTGGSAIPYLGYVEVNLQIPGIRDVLLLVILTMTYSKKVPVMVGSKIIHRAMGMIMKGEQVRANVTWKQAHFGAVMSGLLHLPLKGTKGEWVLKGNTPSAAPDHPAPKEFYLDDVQEHVHTTWKVTIPLFGTINILGKTDIQGHCIWDHVLAKPAQGSQLLASIVPTTMYEELHPSSSWV